MVRYDWTIAELYHTQIRTIKMIELILQLNKIIPHEQFSSIRQGASLCFSIYKAYPSRIEVSWSTVNGGAYILKLYAYNQSSPTQHTKAKDPTEAAIQVVSMLNEFNVNLRREKPS